jgi:hypothetical protein
MTYKKSKETIKSVINKIDNKKRSSFARKFPKWAVAAFLTAGIAVTAPACSDDDDTDNCNNCDYAAPFFDENARNTVDGTDIEDTEQFNDEDENLD